MTVMEHVASAVISVEADCDGSPLCREIATGLYEQLRKGYEVCSVMQIPGTIDEWRAEHRTARKRASHCSRLGYRFEQVQRHMFSDQVLAVNTSAETRQGRRMSESYWRRPSDSPLPDYPCRRHCVLTYGVLKGSTLAGYLWLYRAGDLCLVSSILGHADHLRNDVMFALFEGVVADLAGEDGTLIYNRADSGTPGLRFFKERLGFTAQRVEWLR